MVYNNAMLYCGHNFVDLNFIYLCDFKIYVFFIGFSFNPHHGTTGFSIYVLYSLYVISSLLCFICGFSVYYYIVGRSYSIYTYVYIIAAECERI